MVSREALEQQTVSVFKQRWEALREFSPNYQVAQLAWLFAKYGFDTVEQLFDFWSQKKQILDAGCGNGYLLGHMAEASPQAVVQGVDPNAGVAAREFAVKYENVLVAEMSILDIPHTWDGHWDHIICDGVLQHTKDPKAGFLRLAKLLDEGGDMLVHVYGPNNWLRDLTDRELRKITTQMNREALMEFCEQMANLGEMLREQNVEIRVPEVPLLGFKAGTYDLQEFFFYHVLHCFCDWTGGSTHKDNVEDEYNWWAPAFASKHPLLEVEKWCSEAGLVIRRAPKANRTGTTVFVARD